MPPLPDILECMSFYASQAPNITLPITDPLIPCIPNDTEISTKPSDHDIDGRSNGARYAEAVLCILRADRQLVKHQPELLEIALLAKVLAQDAIAVPGGSRTFFASAVSIDVLADFARESEGALSYSLGLLDETNVAWHTSTISVLRNQYLSKNADFLQCIFVSLSKGGDVSLRVFRDVLSSLLRQSGAGEAEAEVWLAYAMSSIDKG